MRTAEVRAHPRSRGENPASSSPSTPVKGSSPLTRGKPPQKTRTREQRRLIPAHAGKTRRPPPRIPRSRAHPRSRGENTIVVGMVREGMGSSPLTRGKRDRLWRGVCGVRLIPTHAGKTTPDDPPLHLPPAHPHSRGENNGFEVTTIPVKGSSPLTRGKHENPVRVRL